MDSLTLDTLYRGENLEFTYSPMGGLGTGGTIEVTGNKLAGRISVQTGSDCDTKTLARINFPEGNFFDTDNIEVFLFSKKFFNVAPQGEEANGFEIYSEYDWEANTNYEFRYFIIAHLQ